MSWLVTIPEQASRCRACGRGNVQPIARYFPGLAALAALAAKPAVLAGRR